MAQTRTAAQPPVLAVVDDDEALLNALAFAFEVDRFEVAAFADAESLLAAAPPGVGCYVIDLKLPGISGLALLEHLRLQGEAAPAVLITSNPTCLTRRRVRALQAELIEKPLLDDMLHCHVRAVAGWPN